MGVAAEDSFAPVIGSASYALLVHIGTVPIGLAIVEMSEQVLMRYVDGEYIRNADYRTCGLPQTPRTHSLAQAGA